MPHILPASAEIVEGGGAIAEVSASLSVANVISSGMLAIQLLQEQLNASAMDVVSEQIT